jgi:hypothetical protein
MIKLQHLDNEKDIEKLNKFLTYLGRYFYYITKYKQKVLIISNRGIKPIKFYCTKFHYDYILADSETLVNRIFTNYQELKKSKKNSGYLTAKQPSLLFLAHNIYNSSLYTFNKYGVMILCAVKIENTGNGLTFVEPALFFFSVKIYKLENERINLVRRRIEMFANFIFLMLFFYLVKVRIGYFSTQWKRKTKSDKKKNKPNQQLVFCSLIQTNRARVHGKQIPTNTTYKRNTGVLNTKYVKNTQKKINTFFQKPKTAPIDYILRNSVRIGPARTTKKKYNFRRYFRYVQPRRYLKEALYDRKTCRFKKLIQLKFNLNDWIFNILRLKIKTHFYKNFLLVKAPYFALSNKTAGLYKLELQLNFLLLRAFFAPTLHVANLLILNKYVLVNDKENSKPLTKVNIMSIISLPRIIQFTLFLFKPFHTARFFIHRKVLRYLRYKYYFRRAVFKKYYYFNYFNKRLQRLLRFGVVKKWEHNKKIRLLKPAIRKRFNIRTYRSLKLRIRNTKNSFFRIHIIKPR